MNHPKSTVEFGYMCPRGLTGPPAVTTHHLNEIQKETSTYLNKIDQNCYFVDLLKHPVCFQIVLVLF